MIRHREIRRRNHRDRDLIDDKLNALLFDDKNVFKLHLTIVL